MRRMYLLLPVTILILVFTVGIVLTNPSRAQNTSNFNPTPLPLDSVDTIVMPPVDVTALLIEDKIRAAHGLPSPPAQAETRFLSRSYSLVLVSLPIPSFSWEKHG